MSEHLSFDALQQLSKKEQHNHALKHGIPQADGTVFTKPKFNIKESGKFNKALFNLSKHRVKHNISAASTGHTITIGPLTISIGDINGGYYGIDIKINLLPFFEFKFSFGFNPSILKTITFEFTLLADNSPIVLWIFTSIPWIKYICPLLGFAYGIVISVEDDNVEGDFIKSLSLLNEKNNVVLGGFLNTGFESTCPESSGSFEFRWMYNIKWILYYLVLCFACTYVSMCLHDIDC
jgi:hypothetical protein